MHTKLIKHSIAAAGLACAVLTQANAALIGFDLETIVPAAGTVTSASQTVGVGSSAVTLTVTRVGGSTFEIFNLAPFSGPPGFLTHSLSPFTDVSGGAFIFSFSGPGIAAGFSSIGVDYGDFEPSDIDTAVLSAGTGSVTATFPSPGPGFGLHPLFLGSVGPSCVRTATASGGSPAFPQSVYWDNIRIDTCAASVPEPDSWGLVLVALAAAGAIARRQRKA